MHRGFAATGPLAPSGDERPAGSDSTPHCGPPDEVRLARRHLQGHLLSCQPPLARLSPQNHGARGQRWLLVRPEPVCRLFPDDQDGTLRGARRRAFETGNVMETLDTLARHLGPRGEVVLRRRRGAGADVEELIVNGVFAMDSTDTWTERKLAEIALAGSRPRRVLVGGLGLGYTAAELLAADVEHLDVVEIEDCLVEWAYAGLTPTLAAVAARLPGRPARRRRGRGADRPPSGPDRAVGRDPARRRQRSGLPHPRNQRRSLHTAHCWRPRTPGLRTAAPSPSGARVRLRTCSPALRRLSPSAQPHPFTRVRAGRTLAYVIYTVTRARADRRGG